MPADLWNPIFRDAEAARKWLGARGSGLPEWSGLPSSQGGEPCPSRRAERPAPDVLLTASRKHTLTAT
jgi:hypothetical protein